MKKFSLLFAIVACSLWLNATNVKVRLLIPSDSEFNISGDVIFSWGAVTGGGGGVIKSPKALKTIPYANNIVLTRESATSRWWGATVIIPDDTEFHYLIYTETSSTTTDEAFVIGSSPSSYVAKNKPELYLEMFALGGDDGSGNRSFACGEVPANTPDHDYSITAWDVEEIDNGLIYTWTATNTAPNYYFEVLDDAYNVVYGDFATITDGKFTYHYDGATDVTVNAVLFYPCYYDGTDLRPYNQIFYKIVNFKFKSPATIIEESLKAQEKNNTIEISWTHPDAVTRYEAYVEYGGESVKDFVVLPQYMPATDGKYTLIVDNLIGNGNYEISFFAIDANGMVVVDTYVGANVTGLPALGQVELNVLIPSDNDMDITYGVWFEWWDVETATHAFVKADQDAAGVWFSKTINTTSSAIKFRVCNTSDASGSNSSVSSIIKTNKACFEMAYQSYHTWYLYESACDATDHDYTILSLNMTSSATGFLEVTVVAKDYAPFYQIEARENGSGSYFTTLAYLPYSGSNSAQLPVPFTKTADYDYRVTPLNEHYQQAAPEITGTINIKGNINVPTNLQTIVGTDGQTVAFSWTYSGMGVDHYTLEVDEMTFENILVPSFTHKFYLQGTHTWSVSAYSSTGVLMGYAICDTPFDITTPFYDPENLNVSVSGNTATLTWTAQNGVAAAHILLYEPGGDEALNTIVNANAGQFTATYTLSEDKTIVYEWRVQSLTADGEPMSYDVTGPAFAIVGSSSTAIEQIDGEAENELSIKVIRDGRLLILHDGKTFDMMGRLVEE